MAYRLKMLQIVFPRALSGRGGVGYNPSRSTLCCIRGWRRTQIKPKSQGWTIGSLLSTEAFQNGKENKLLGSWPVSFDENVRLTKKEEAKNKSTGQTTTNVMTYSHKAPAKSRSGSHSGTQAPVWMLFVPTGHVHVIQPQLTCVRWNFKTDHVSVRWP